MVFVSRDARATGWKCAEPCDVCQLSHPRALRGRFGKKMFRDGEIEPLMKVHEKPIERIWEYHKQIAAPKLAPSHHAACPRGAMIKYWVARPEALYRVARSEALYRVARSEDLRRAWVR